MMATTPVLISGAGPAGLTTAIMLARRGIGSMLVERRPDSSTLPRATAVSTRTMEIVRSWGLEPQVRAGEIDVAPRGFATGTLSSPEGMPLQLGFPDAAEAAAFSPVWPAVAPQDHLEQVMLDHLRSYPCARIRFGTELVGLEQDDDGVTVELHDVATGTLDTVRAEYVVGADGTKSTVREQLGIVMEGPDNLAVHETALFRAPLWHVVGDRRFGIYMIMDPEAAGVLVPCGQGDRWLFGREWQPDETPQDTEGDLVRQLRIATGVPDLEPRIERIGRFTFAAQVADRYRSGRGFVVGDAAHRITPRGGTGMNTAIHDGYDLGWKLAWVLSGWAGTDLLDSYERERRPVGARNAARSARPDGSNADLEQTIAEDLGGRLPHAWVGPGKSTLDLLGEGLTVLTGPEASDHRPGGALPIRFESLDEDAARAVGIDPGGAALVRPDGQVVRRWPAGEVVELSVAIAGLLGLVPVTA